MEPQSRIGLASLTKLAFQGVDLHPLQAQLLSQCLTEDNTEGALMDLSVIEQLQGNQEMGLQWQAKALAKQRAFITNQSNSAQRRLLVFAQPSHMGANTPIEFLLQNSGFEIITYYPSLGCEGSTPAPDIALPDHDVAFCAAPTDAKQADHFFATVRQLTQRAGTAAVNLPSTQISLGRDALAKIFSFVPGLRLPKTTRATLDQLVTALINDSEEQMLAPVGGFPIVIRPCGAHAGKGLAKVVTRDALITYLTEHPEPEFFLSEFVNYASSQDGQFRKYRVVFVDGKPFPCHMAIADQWDIWYLNAGMEASDAKRQDEADFMDHFDHDFSLRHHQALSALTDAIDLDYFGIDCAEDADGNLVVFEADNALIVHDMDSEAVFPYKREHMQRIFTAVEEMLLKKCRFEGGRDPAPFQYRQDPPPNHVLT